LSVAVVEPIFTQDTSYVGIAPGSDVCVLSDVIHEAFDPHLACSTVISVAHLQTLYGQKHVAIDICDYGFELSDSGICVCYGTYLWVLSFVTSSRS
jgi:hypothetical protein